jgi:hypothetical protein
MDSVYLGPVDISTKTLIGSLSNKILTTESTPQAHKVTLDCVKLIKRIIRSIGRLSANATLQRVQRESGKRGSAVSVLLSL